MKARSPHVPLQYTVGQNGQANALFVDGKPLKTPAGVPYRLPTAALAEAVLAEWRMQSEKINFAFMPLTQLAATALDIVANDREKIVDRLLAYAASELLCHRSEAPLELAQKQQEIWQPLLDWCASRFDALLHVGSGIMPVDQTPEAVSALHRALVKYDDFLLTGLSSAADVTGSLVLGLAMVEGEKKADAIFEAAELDTTFQALIWGMDPILAVRFDSVRRELDVCESWFSLLR